MLKILIFLLLINSSLCALNDIKTPNYSTALSQAVIDYIVKFFMHSSSNLNFYQVSIGNISDTNWDIINEILYHVKAKVVIQVDNLKDERISIGRQMNSLIFIDSFTSFNKFFHKMNLVDFDYQGHFLIIFTMHVEDIYLSMMKTFDALWIKSIINANVLFMPPENYNEALLYTYYPYSRFYCESVTPIQLNQYRNDNWINKIVYFPKKLKNLHGCPLRVATFVNPPFMFVNEDKQTGKVDVDGVDGIMLRVLAQFFNFNVQLYIPKEYWGDVYENGTVTGAIKMIVEQEINMTLGFFASTPTRDTQMKPGYAYYTTQLVWIVPPGFPQSALQKLRNPLRYIIWILTSISIIVGFIVILILKRQPKVIRDFVFGTNVQSPCMNMISIVFGSSIHHLPRRNFARFILVVFLLYCFVLRSCYTGGLVKFMQMDTRGQQIKTTLELVEKNFTYYMQKSARNFMLEMPRILNRTVLIEFDEYKAGLVRLRDDPYAKYCYLTSTAHLAYRNLLEFPKTYNHFAPESIYTLNIVIYYHKESCLTHPFDEAVMNLVSSGLVFKWASKFINRKYLQEPINNGAKILNFHQLEGSFQLLLVGLFIGSLVFCMECLMACKFMKKYKRLFKKNMKRLKIKMKLKYFKTERRV